MPITIRNYRPKDWVSVEAIYRAGISTGIATFETQPKSQQLFESAAIAGSILVAVNPTDGVHGWACLWPVSDRCAYAGVAEVSVYVAPNRQGEGIGAKLLHDLVKRSEMKGMWTLQSGILAGNDASVQLHEKCGFRIVGKRERLGHRDGQWHDVIFMERRSQTVGQ